jgi:hypothetical protein
MTVEWHDNEPTFPDFLPPLPEPKVLTAAAAAERLKGVLEAAGITADFRIGTMWDLTFPDGAKCYEEDFYVVADGYSR